VSAVAAPAPVGLRLEPSLWTQVAVLARRSIVRTARQPATVFFAFCFPLFLLAVNSGGLQAATQIPGFPTDDYLTFALGVPCLQAGLFAIGGAGSDLAQDIRTGFLDRLSLTPMQSAALLLGHLAGIAVLATMQGAVFLLVGFIAGASFEAGLAGAAVIVLLTVLSALGFGSLGMLVALRTGSGEAVQSIFPLVFVFLFLSSSSLPRDLIAVDWFRTVATYNPVSYIVEAMRAPLIYGWDWGALALGFAIAGTIFVVFLTASTMALRTRLTRT
jgi:ABC-2 type transport system permease protein